MATQTFLDPKTGATRTVDVGSRDANTLFAQGWTSGGSNQQTVTMASTPGATGARTLGDIFSSASTSGIPTTGLTPPPVLAGPPKFAGIEKFNTKLMDLLTTYQGLNPATLMTRRNALLKAQYGKISEATPEELQTLSPAEQASIRTGKANALQPEVESIANQITSYQGAIQNFGNVLTMAQSIGDSMYTKALDEYRLGLDVADRNYQRQKDFQTGLQSQVFNLIGTFGYKAFEGTSPDQIKQLETLAGIPTGALSSGFKALKDADKKASKDKELETIKTLAFSEDTLAAGKLPAVFAKEFPGLIGLWQSMSTVARQRFQSEMATQAASRASSRASQTAAERAGSDYFGQRVDEEYKNVISGKYGVNGSREGAINSLLGEFGDARRKEIEAKIYGTPTVDKKTGKVTYNGGILPDGYESRIQIPTTEPTQADKQLALEYDTYANRLENQGDKFKVSDLDKLFKNNQISVIVYQQIKSNIATGSIKVPKK